MGCEKGSKVPKSRLGDIAAGKSPCIKPALVLEIGRFRVFTPSILTFLLSYIYYIILPHFLPSEGNKEKNSPKCKLAAALVAGDNWGGMSPGGESETGETAGTVEKWVFLTHPFSL